MKTKVGKKRKKKKKLRYNVHITLTELTIQSYKRLIMENTNKKAASVFLLTTTANWGTTQQRKHVSSLIGPDTNIADITEVAELMLLTTQIVTTLQQKTKQLKKQAEKGRFTIGYVLDSDPTTTHEITTTTTDQVLEPEPSTTTYEIATSTTNPVPEFEADYGEESDGEMTNLAYSPPSPAYSPPSLKHSITSCPPPLSEESDLDDIDGVPMDYPEAYFACEKTKPFVEMPLPLPDESEADATTPNNEIQEVGEMTVEGDFRCQGAISMANLITITSTEGVEAWKGECAGPSNRPNSVTREEISLPLLTSREERQKQLRERVYDYVITGNCESHLHDIWCGKRESDRLTQFDRGFSNKAMQRVWEAACVRMFFKDEQKQENVLRYLKQCTEMFTRWGGTRLSRSEAPRPMRTRRHTSRKFNPYSLSYLRPKSMQSCSSPIWSLINYELETDVLLPESVIFAIQKLLKVDCMEAEKIYLQSRNGNFSAN